MNLETNKHFQFFLKKKSWGAITRQS